MSFKADPDAFARRRSAWLQLHRGADALLDELEAALDEGARLSAEIERLCAEREQMLTLIETLAKEEPGE